MKGTMHLVLTQINSLCAKQKNSYFKSKEQQFLYLLGSYNFFHNVLLLFSV